MGDPQDNTADEALTALGRWLRNTNYQFVTPTPLTHERVNQRPGNEQARRLEHVLGWSRPFAQSSVPPEVWTLMERAGVLVPAQALWRSTVRASTLGPHLFFHSAYPTHAADAVFFGPDTYRFADAIDRHLDEHAPLIERGVDIGCGAGPGAAVLAARHPRASIDAVDINPQALRLARINARINQLPNLAPCLSNLLTGVDGDFDFVVSNPPYLVDADERAYRHGGGPLGAGLSLAIVEAALQRLRPAGTLLLYTGAAIVDGQDPFRQAVLDLVTKANASWTYRETDPDVFGEELEHACYAQADRIAAVVLTATMPRG